MLNAHSFQNSYSRAISGTLGTRPTALSPYYLNPYLNTFFEVHHSNPKGLQFRGIDHVYMGIRGGNVKQKLLQKETRWMVTLDTLSPTGLNEAISFKSFL
ncbi:unnamed protein product [Ranitomeya imitator]|uniref:Uncharacterized protein n=1 Tax=Ranitomeya imitator TaxID=111125 RepID=A0ABN9M1Q2_9NEOB|nr:unnamed protein product [Ranitomeya imitator]